MFEDWTLIRALEAVLVLLSFTVALHCLKLLKSFTGQTISSILHASEAITLIYAAYKLYHTWKNTETTTVTHLNPPQEKPP